MSIDSELRQSVISFVDQGEPVSMTPVGHLNQAANRRSRRTRTLRGVTAFSMALLVVIGVGLARRGPDTSAVFAGQSIEFNTEPSDAVLIDDRFVGVAKIEPTGFDVVDTDFIVVSSDDGAAWQRVPDSPMFRGATLVVGEHEGTLHMVGTRDTSSAVVAEASNVELFHATSTDLVTWSEQTQPLPEAVALEEHIVTVQNIVVAEAGVLAQIQVRPGPRLTTLRIEPVLAEAGYDRESICEMGSTRDSARIRPCGQKEAIFIPIEEPLLAEPVVDSHIVLALAGEGFSVVEPPTVALGPNATWHRTIYATSDGFGISGLENVESVDGVDWTPLETGEDVSPFVAARGDERVFRTVRPVRRFTDDDPAVGMAYSPDGTTWNQIRVDEMYAELGRTPVVFSELHSSSSGWVLVVRNSVLDPQNPVGLETTGTGEFADFTITVDGSVLTGTRPYGPAVLRDPAGTIVREWETLEVSNTGWSGLEIEPDGIVIRHEETGELLFKITKEQWGALLHPPSSDLASITDILFSSDGQNWEIINSSTSPPEIIAIGDNSIVVTRWDLGWFYDEVRQPQLETIPLPPPTS